MPQNPNVNVTLHADTTRARALLAVAEHAVAHQLPAPNTIALDGDRLTCYLGHADHATWYRTIEVDEERSEQSTAVMGHLVVVTVGRLPTGEQIHLRSVLENNDGQAIAVRVANPTDQGDIA